jgi:hypothetical protein
LGHEWATQKEHDDRREQQLPPPGDPVVVVRFVRTYGVLVFTVFLVFVLSGALIRWVTGSVWASNIGGLVAALGYLWVGRMLWRRRIAEDASEAALEAHYQAARQHADGDAVEQDEGGSRRPG